MGGDENDIESGCTFGFKVYDNDFLNEANGSYVVQEDPEITKGNYCINIEGDQHQQVYVYNNYIQRYGWGIELSTPTSGEGYWEHYWQWDGVYVYYNIIENIGYSDLAYSQGIYFLNEDNLSPYYGTFTNIVIANNVITGDNGGSYAGYIGILFNCNGYHSNITVSNNIITGFSSPAARIQRSGDDTYQLINVNFIYNDFYNNGVDAVTKGSGMTETSLNTTTGNITSNPTWVGGSPYSYVLQAGSDCIDAGYNVGLNEDYGGNLVPFNDVVDIGAYEYGSTITPEASGLGTSDGKFLKTGNVILVIQ